MFCSVIFSEAAASPRNSKNFSQRASYQKREAVGWKEFFCDFLTEGFQAQQLKSKESFFVCLFTENVFWSLILVYVGQMDTLKAAHLGWVSINNSLNNRAGWMVLYIYDAASSTGFQSGEDQPSSPPVQQHKLQQIKAGNHQLRTFTFTICVS